MAGKPDPPGYPYRGSSGSNGTLRRQFCFYWQAALHIKSTSTYGVTFQWGLGNRVQLELYVDTDYAHETNDRMSVSGGDIMCAGAFKYFHSRTQKSSTLLSTEAEYVAMVTCFPKTIFMRYLSSYIFSARDVGCTTVKEDYEGSIQLAKFSMTTLSSKHIDVRHHFLRKRDANVAFVFVDVSSALHHVDFLTKPFKTEAFRFYRNLVMSLCIYIYISCYIFSAGYRGIE